MTTVDPITLELVDNALYSLEKEMEAIILRTAVSIVIREVYDFGIATLDAKGRLVHGLPMSARLILETFPHEKIYEGDVFIFNDPYLSRGEMTHLGDTQLCRPVFWEGELVAFAAVWGHQMDVGGISISGLPATSTDIFSEGIQIPPVKLYERGHLNDAVLQIMARNSRTPQMMIGDTLAMAAACTVTTNRLHELLAKFGLATIRACFDVYAQRSAGAMAQLIEQLPADPVGFDDYLDDDGVEPGFPHLCLTIYKENGRLVVDYAGTSGQTRGPINLIMNPDRQKLELWRYLINWVGPLIGLAEEASPNYGIFDLVDFKLPYPSLVSPAYPAAVGARHMTNSLNRNLFRGVMAQIYPQRTPACANGVIPTYMFSGVHPVTGQLYVSMECIAGGGGARPTYDGLDGLTPNPNLTIAPVEFIEATYPFRVNVTALRRDTGGSGKYRGGLGLIRSFELQAAEARLSWLDDRQTHPAWGLFGGRPGIPGDAYLVRDGRVLRLPTKYDNLDLVRGDQIIVRTGGGGGYGPPWERELDLVTRDVLREFVSVERAEEDYGVVCHSGPTGLEVDRAATDSLRRRMAAERSVEWIDRGAVRWAPPPGELAAVESIPDLV